MNDFLRMCFNIITQIGPYLVVLLLLKYLVNLQQKRAKEREEEQKKGIIRTHYTNREIPCRGIYRRYNIFCLLYGYES